MPRMQLLVFLGASGVSALALAHPGGAPHVDLQAGLAHPFAGLDHALAALAVGLWAAAQTGSRRWLAPLLFVALLGAGITIGLRFGVFPGLETGLALSVIALGGLVVAWRRAATGAALAIIGVFALLHGAAHGGEAPAGALAAVTWYGAGLMLGTFVLHALGFVGGAALHRVAPTLWRGAGAGVACVGLLLLAH